VVRHGLNTNPLISGGRKQIMDQAIKELTTPGGPHDLGRDWAQITVRTLRLLARGNPVSKAELASAISDLDQERSEQVLKAWAERNAAGDLVGLGLTYNPTSQQLTIDGARMWAWCAMDTLIFACLLERTLTVESTPPGSQETVRLTVSHTGVNEVNPSNAVITWPTAEVSELALTSTDAIWGAFCHHSFFFPSREQAEQWKGARADIQIKSLEEAHDSAREIAQAILARAA
jgi:alkylmercury lyase